MNEGLGELRVSKTLFYVIGKKLPITQKMLRKDRTAAEVKFETK